MQSNFTPPSLADLSTASGLIDLIIKASNKDVQAAIKSMKDLAQKTADDRSAAESAATKAANDRKTIEGKVESNNALLEKLAKTKTDIDTANTALDTRGHELDDREREFNNTVATHKKEHEKRTKALTANEKHAADREAEATDAKVKADNLAADYQAKIDNLHGAMNAKAPAVAAG